MPHQGAVKMKPRSKSPMNEINVSGTSITSDNWETISKEHTYTSVKQPSKSGQEKRYLPSISAFNVLYVGDAVGHSAVFQVLEKEGSKNKKQTSI